MGFFKPSKEGVVLHLTKSGKWEKCNIPVGCTRHVDVSKLSAAELNKIKTVFLVDEEWSEEAHLNRSNVLSADDYNGYETDDVDTFDSMKVVEHDSNGEALPDLKTFPYEFKRTNYHYICPTCGVPFEPTKTVGEMDAQLGVHDCDNLTPVEMHKKRKLFKETYGAWKIMEMTDFYSEHDECKSYQTACVDCAEKHELRLYKLFSREELGAIVREDSMFYNPNRELFLTTTDVNGEKLNFMSHELRGVLSDFPQFYQWQYLPDKSERQLQLEREDVNYGNHIDDDNNCRVCGQHVYDMYCMDCWVPSGYLLEE